MKLPQRLTEGHESDPGTVLVRTAGLDAPGPTLRRRVLGAVGLVAGGACSSAADGPAPDAGPEQAAERSRPQSVPASWLFMAAAAAVLGGVGLLRSAALRHSVLPLPDPSVPAVALPRAPAVEPAGPAGAFPSPEHPAAGGPPGLPEATASSRSNAASPRVAPSSLLADGAASGTSHGSGGQADPLLHEGSAEYGSDTVSAQDDSNAPAELTASSNDRSLATEVALIDAARAAMRAGDAKTALARLDDHDRLFASGGLSTEAAVLRIEALANAGHAGQASELAARFLRAHPESPLRSRVRKAITRKEDTP